MEEQGFNQVEEMWADIPNFEGSYQTIPEALELGWVPRSWNHTVEVLAPFPDLQAAVVSEVKRLYPTYEDLLELTIGVRG